MQELIQVLERNTDANVIRNLKRSTECKPTCLLAAGKIQLQKPSNTESDLTECMHAEFADTLT